MPRSEEHTSELQSRVDLVCRLLLEKKKKHTDGTERNKKYARDKAYHTNNFCIYYHSRFLCLSIHSGLNQTFSALSFFFFFNDTATTEIYTLSLHDALPISAHRTCVVVARQHGTPQRPRGDRKSTRLNSSHEWISYAVFCLKKKK